ncbi:hypothetical protein FHS85_003397 [Rhodoligotrophos appendicifer]|uniref:hypothetical protein n=1 Tax=Rhodoligotrophos appendicifer TaxID=987056 RepID=UPI0011866A5D|nr:hypothetical protein [Rhodoligotrophos appendicifer]
MAIFSLFILAGCNAGNHPFAKEVGTLASPRDTEAWPRITVVSFSGLPDGKDEMFLQALAAETYRRQIALLTTPPSAQVFSLSGSVSARIVDGRTAVGWNWEVKGAKDPQATAIIGQEVIQIPKGAAVEAVKPETGDPWDKVNDFMLRRVAMHLAESLSGFFGERGYLTQTAGLPPPVETFVRAGPGAEKAIDLSMLGPNELSMRIARGQVTAEDMIDSGVVPPQPPDEIEADPTPAPEKTKVPGQKEITSVAVSTVKGAPGDGNRALAASLVNILKRAGWPVKQSAGDETLIIEGQVGVAAPQGGAQQVALEWTVKDPSGDVLGSVKQANQVPAGSLDGHWGLTADYAAEAAAQGIFDLIGKLR